MPYSYTEATYSNIKEGGWSDIMEHENKIMLICNFEVSTFTCILQLLNM